MSNNQTTSGGWLAQAPPLAIAISTVYSAVLLFILIDKIDIEIGWETIIMVIIMVLVWAWAVAPVLWLALFRVGQPFPEIAAILSAGVGLYGYLDTFYGPKPDALDGLVFIFLPFFQWLFSAVVSGLLLVFRAVFRK